MSAPSRTRHRLTSRLFAAVLLTFALLQAAAVSGSAWFLLLAGAVVGLAATSLPARARLDGLAVHVEHPPRVSAGDTLPVHVSVVNEGTGRSSAATLLLHTHGLEQLVVSVGRLDPGERVGTVLQRQSERRGVADETTGVLVSRPSLGLREGVRAVSVAGHLVVHPALRHRADRPVTHRQEAGRDRLTGATAAAGSEVLGVREWRSGDDPAHVHWRSTARSGRLTLLERGSAQVEELRVVLVGSDRDPGFEDALSEAATVCDREMRSAGAVTVVAWHADGPVIGATGSRWDLLDWWSTVHDTVLPDPRAFGGTALAGFGPGDLLVAGPPEVDARWLAAAADACPGLTLRRLEAA